MFAEAAHVTDRIIRRFVRLLERRGVAPDSDPGEAGPLRRDHPSLAEAQRYKVFSRGRSTASEAAPIFFEQLGEDGV
jgi:hypothetical protein